MNTGIITTRRNRADTPTASRQAKGAVASAARSATRDKAIEDAKAKASLLTSEPVDADAARKKAELAHLTALEKRIKMFGKTEVNQRDALHLLLCDSIQHLNTFWSPAALTMLVRTLHEAKARRLDDIMTWIWAATGGYNGMVDVEGASRVSVLPRMSVLSFSQGKGTAAADKNAEQGRAKEKVFGFSVRKLTRDEIEETRVAITLHTEYRSQLASIPDEAGKEKFITSIAQEARVERMHTSFAAMRDRPYWSFTPERIASPYAFSSFLSAMKKAYKNLDSEALTEKDRTFLREVLTLAEERHYKVMP